MLTFDSVLKVFEEYINEDEAAEIFKNRHGYTLMLWDHAAHDWSNVRHCSTPEKLFDGLLDFYISYNENKIVAQNGDITDEEILQAEKLRIPFLEKRRELEGT